MILVIDNYDSFTYNLVHLLEATGAIVTVRRNDAIDIDGIAALGPAGIVLSPGPGRPADAGVTLDVVREMWSEVPILGVCLGHQAIAEAFGARVVRAAEPVHGKTSSVRHDGAGVFDGLPRELTVMRYHSLVVDPDTLPVELEPQAWSDDGTLMALRHRSAPLHGVQFHPESILSDSGQVLMANWVRRVNQTVPA